jgi:hypothetical protein
MKKAQQRTKVPVTARALVQRINRCLVRDGMKLKKTKGVQAFLTLGDYFTIDTTGNYVIDKKVDIEYLGRKRRVLAAWERLDEKA